MNDVDYMVGNIVSTGKQKQALGGSYCIPMWKCTVTREGGMKDIKYVNFFVLPDSHAPQLGTPLTSLY